MDVRTFGELIDWTVSYTSILQLALLIAPIYTKKSALACCSIT